MRSQHSSQTMGNTGCWLWRALMAGTTTDTRWRLEKYELFFYSPHLMISSPHMKPLPLLFPAPLTSVSCWLCVFQADACHAYQIVHKNGIPDEQIVVMMYDDLAQNEEWVDIFASASDLCDNQTSLPSSVCSLASRAGAISCLISLIIDRSCISYFHCFWDYAHRLVFPALNVFTVFLSFLYFISVVSLKWNKHILLKRHLFFSGAPGSKMLQCVHFAPHHPDHEVCNHVEQPREGRPLQELWSGFTHDKSVIALNLELFL